MKIKMYIIDLEIPRRAKRVAVLVGLPVGVLFGVVAIAYASITTFKSGDPLSSATMNANFADLNTRLAALEGKAPDGGGVVLGAIVWKDSKGAVMPVVRAIDEDYLETPQSRFDIYDGASKAVWLFGLYSPVTVSPVVASNLISSVYTMSGCAGPEYVEYPPPPRYAFALGTHPGKYFVVADGVVPTQAAFISANFDGGGCSSTSMSLPAVPFSSLVEVTMPSAPPGVPPYHPEPL